MDGCLAAIAMAPQLRRPCSGWRGLPGALKSVADKLQEIVGSGSLRMTIGSLGFPTGQALLDWLKATNQPFNAVKVSQTVGL